MASLNEMDIMSDSVARSLGYVSLESEQKAVIKDFVTGNDVFAVLTTGYGKSLCCDAPVDRDLFPGRYRSLLKTHQCLIYIDIIRN